MNPARLHTTAALLLWFGAGSACAQMRVEVIPLQNRFPADVIPVIQPLLPPGASVTGMNNQLIVKTTPENLAEIRNLLDSIDLKLRRLRIFVRQDVEGFGNRTQQSLSGHADLGDVTLRQGGRHPHDGVAVGVGAEDVNIQYRRQDSAVSGADRASYQVQTVEGQPAYIRTGQAVPVPQRTVAAPNGVIVVQDTVEYYDADSGFWVLPRLSGDAVTLLIAPRTTKVNPGAIPRFDIQGAETTITGRLGQWLDIGGISQTSSGSSHGWLGSETQRDSRETSIQVLVEEIP